MKVDQKIPWPTAMFLVGSVVGFKTGCFLFWGGVLVVAFWERSMFLGEKRCIYIKHLYKSTIHIFRCKMCMYTYKLTHIHKNANVYM